MNWHYLGYQTLVLFPQFWHPLTCTIRGVSQILTTVLVMPNDRFIRSVSRKRKKKKYLPEINKLTNLTHHYFIHPVLCWICCFQGTTWCRVIISDNSCVSKQIMQRHRCQIFISKQTKKSFIQIHSALIWVEDSLIGVRSVAHIWSYKSSNS